MSFDEFKAEIEAFESPKQRLGIFNVRISCAGRVFDFQKLKVSANSDADFMGFSLNHYGWHSELPQPRWKTSKFHDSEDVDVIIEREDFVKVFKICHGQYELRMKTWVAKITVEQ